MNCKSGKRQAEGAERIARVQQALSDAELDGLVCTLPSFVLMLSGYWPVIGTAIAIVTREGEVAVLVPEDELEFAEHGWAHRIVTFHPASLRRITTPALEAAGPLHDLLHGLGLQCARIAYEYGEVSEPSSYSGMNLYASTLIDMLRTAASSAPLAPANQLLHRLTCTKTSAEVGRIRMACQIAAQAFERGQLHVRESCAETEIAAAFRAGFGDFGMAQPDIKRADGFTWCMSGPNSAKAKGAYACSSARRIGPREMLLVHANSYADGYWTDITRNYLLGEPDEKQRKIYSAIAEAREAAFAKIRPGAHAREVDRAAREVIKKHGFEEEFPHSTGHGVGFASISANACPRIHPHSDEVLETGMTFNIEPAVYIEGYGAARHCDMVAVTETGMKLLTDFQNQVP